MGGYEDILSRQATFASQTFLESFPFFLPLGERFLPFYVYDIKTKSFPRELKDGNVLNNF